MAKILKAITLLSACILAQPANAEGVARPMGYLHPPKRHGVVRSQAAGSPARKLLSAGKSAEIPSRWDSRDYGWVTPVRNQNPFGTCWTFAACATIETQLLKAGRGTWDFSEKNLASLHGFEVPYASGGNNDMAAAYFLRWGGAVAESNDVYKTSAAAWNASPSRQLDPAMHVQNVVWIPARSSADDNDTLKAAIMEYGAVSVSYYHDDWYIAAGGAYYCYSYTNTAYQSWGNHAVTAVGWDDDYPAENFASACRPPGDGAWLIKNSWGPYYGDGGYIHISYYDMTFMAVCDDGAVFVPATADEDYTAVYGYDRLGVIDYATSSSSNWKYYNMQGAVFTSAYNEEVAAVGIYSTIEGNPYVVSIYTNVTRGASSPTSGGVLAYEQSGTLPHAGFTTVRLESPVPLADRTVFSVVYRQTGSVASHCLNYSCDMDESGTPYAVCNHEKGLSYIGRKGRFSTTWEDAATYYSDVSACVCLKVYTRSTSLAKAGPGEADSGAAMLAYMEEADPSAYAQFGGSFGAFAGIAGANGLSLWASWLAGFDPSDADDNKLVVDIAVTNGVPSLSWRPDLGSSRVYTVLGADDLAPGAAWRVVDKADLGSSSARFFKVTVGQ